MKVVIIGGDAAGMSAAMEMVRSDVDVNITVLEKGDIYSYGQCGLPYIIDGTITDTDELIAKSVEAFREKGIDARTRHEVTYVDIDEQLVEGTNGHTGEAFSIAYDKLIIASGASPTMPRWNNKQLDGIYTIKTIPQMEALLADLEGKSHVTVIGAGYIALEVAETLVSRGLQVRIIQRGAQLMSTIDAELAEHILAEAQKQGVEVLLNTNTLGFVGTSRVEAVETENGTYETDAVIVATGVRPNTQFIEHTHMHTLANGAIIVNGQMETNVPNIYAAGDCAAHYLRHINRYAYIPLGTTANKQGRIAGKNIAGELVDFKGILGTSVLKFFDVTIGQTGMNNSSVDEVNADVRVIRYTANNHASYYPNVQLMHLCMFVHARTQQLLGLQIVGGDGVDKRIDVFATAMTANMSLKDLSDLDLSYAPPYNGVWDPLQQMANRFSS